MQGPPDEKFDPYKILGVSRLANNDEIEKAYIKLGLKCSRGNPPGGANAERLSELKRAFDILIVPSRRQILDASLLNTAQSRNSVPLPLITNRTLLSDWFDLRTQETILRMPPGGLWGMLRADRNSEPVSNQLSDTLKSIVSGSGLYAKFQKETGIADAQLETLFATAMVRALICNITTGRSRRALNLQSKADLRIELDELWRQLEPIVPEINDEKIALVRHVDPSMMARAAIKNQINMHARNFLASLNQGERSQFNIFKNMLQAESDVSESVEIIRSSSPILRGAIEGTEKMFGNPASDISDLLAFAILNRAVQDSMWRPSTSLGVGSVRFGSLRWAMINSKARRYADQGANIIERQLFFTIVAQNAIAPRSFDRPDGPSLER